MFKIAARKSRGMQRNKDIGLFAKPSKDDKEQHTI